MKVGYSKEFLSQYRDLSPKLKDRVDERILLWQADRSSSQLHDHQLSGKYKGYRSINISGDVRALYMQRGDAVIFDIIGTHSQLYG